jgi:hypothetical protein
MGIVSAKHWFYRTAEQWMAIAERLKQTPCPHCQVVGALIRHGLLYGFDETSKQKTLRARRIFCSNRNQRRGCGRTFSVWLADKIRRLGLTTNGLWRFLQRAVADGIRAASHGSDGPRSERTLLRLWKRFQLSQSTIRTALFGRCPPPELPAEYRSAAQVLAHLQDAFPDAPCPIAAFQQMLRTFFFV